MADLVPPEDIERIVGVSRHPLKHIARVVSGEETIYILHSQRCFEEMSDLRACGYSMALDYGISRAHWRDWEDRPVVVSISPDTLRLIPVAEADEEATDEH